MVLGMSSSGKSRPSCQYLLLRERAMTTLVRAGCLIVAIISLAGCGTSLVHFESPCGAMMYGTKTALDGAPFPVAVAMPQTDDPKDLRNNEIGGRPITMLLSDGTRLRGFMFVYSLSMTRVEKMARVSFHLTGEHVDSLRCGSAVTIIGYTAEDRPVYKVILGLDE